MSSSFAAIRQGRIAHESRPAVSHTEQQPAPAPAVITVVKRRSLKERIYAYLNIDFIWREPR